MKNLLILSALILGMMAAFGQTTITVTKQVDEMTDKVYYFPSRVLIASIDGGAGVSIDPFIRNKGGKLDITSLMVTNYRLGACVENSDFIIKFTDGTKIKMTSWNDFNCDPISYFNPSISDKDALKSKKIEKVYFENGNTHESGTYTLYEDCPSDYFIQVFKSLDNIKI